MGEQLKPSAERHSSPEKQAEFEHKLEKKIGELEREGNEEATHQPELAEEAREAIDHLKVEEAHLPKVENEHKYVGAEKAAIKEETYKRTLTDIRKHLPSKSSRRFSKVIHQPAVEKVSEITAKTVFRPSIMLGASLGALLGGSIIFLIAKYYGFPLSGTEFLLLGLAGAIVGGFIELLVSLGRKVSNKKPSR